MYSPSIDKIRNVISNTSERTMHGAQMYMEPTMFINIIRNR